MKTKILIVEDEETISDGIQSVLVRLDYEVTDIARNYDDALQCVESNQPNLILMDVNLKNSRDGIEIATKILENQYIPIVYLTGFSDEDTLGRAMATEPVGYIMKPFKRDDLKVNIQLALHKAKLHDITYTIDKDNRDLGHGYSFNMSNEVLYYKGLIIKLGTRETRLLKILILANGNVVTFKQIEYEVWSENSISNSTLRTLIYRLRAKLDNKILETVYSSGCRLILPEASN